MKELISYAPGANVAYKGKHYIVMHVLNLQTVLAKEQETGATEQLSINDLRLLEAPAPGTASEATEPGDAGRCVHL